MRLAELFSIFPFGARNRRSNIGDIKDIGISKHDIVIKDGKPVLGQDIKIISPDGKETPYEKGRKVSEIVAGKAR